MPKKSTKQSPYTKKDMSTTTPMQNLPSDSSTISSTYYQHIAQLPLNRFIDVVVDSNIYALVITGSPTLNELHDAWQTISIEYADAIKDQESRLLFSTEKELNRLKLAYHVIIDALGVLKNYYTPQFANVVNELLRTSFKFDIRFPDDYDNDIKRAYNRSKGIKIDIDLKQMSYEALKEKILSSTKKPTREYFQAILITLSDFVKYEIRDTITVFEFCDRIRRLNDYNDKQKLKPNGRR